MDDALAELTSAGVLIWLDDLSRHRLVTGSLADMAARFHVVGVTTNPTIFAKAITGADAYAEQLGDLSARGVGAGEALRALTTFDVRWACDVLRPVYDATGGLDGRVSIEVDPRLAHDTQTTIAEARALWWLVDRPNLFVKIPAARQGLPAITACLADGISINVTLIFSLGRYDAVRARSSTGWSRPNGRAAICRRWPPSRRSSSPALIPRSTRGWTRSARPRRWRCAARRRSPTRDWLMSITSRCSRRRGGPRCRRRGLA